jgi:hypothetical protein
MSVRIPVVRRRVWCASPSGRFTKRKTTRLLIPLAKPWEKRQSEVKSTFDVTKCDKLFDTLLQNSVIRLSDGHVILPPGQLAKGKYCNWHGTFSHNTNNCNYFH